MVAKHKKTPDGAGVFQLLARCFYIYLNICQSRISSARLRLRAASEATAPDSR